MPTGACGINCDICRLNLLGLCTSCGSGRSQEAKVKLATQERILGNACPILSCAVMNNVAYCMRDCSQFPCDNYTIHPYPFSPAYLDMQKRRRKDWVPRIDPLGRPIEIPDEFWEEIADRDVNQIKALTLAEFDQDRRLIFKFLDLTLRLDPLGRQLAIRGRDNMFSPADIPLLTLTVLVYFKTIDRFFPMGKDLISTQDMSGQGSYFTGEHELKTSHVLTRFSGDSKGLAHSAGALGGETVEMGDEGWILRPFPRLAVYYVFWDLDSEYESRLSILFDRPICDIFAPPMVWELVNLVNARLLSV